MGRKVHPIGFRLGINKPWEGRWFAEGKEYRDQLHQDLKIRTLLQQDSEKAGVAKVEVERFPGKVKVVVHTAKPGILIGRKGDNVKKLRQDLETLTGKKIDLDIKEVENPDLNAYLVALNIASQIVRRVSYRRAMKRAIQQALRQGAEGVKIEVAGRLAVQKWPAAYGFVKAVYRCKHFVQISISPGQKPVPPMDRSVSRCGYIPEKFYLRWKRRSNPLRAYT